MISTPVPLRRKLTLSELSRRCHRSWNLAWRPVRNRVPALVPYRRAEVHVVRETALGDVLMATPALRRVKELNPRCRLLFYTHLPELVRDLSFIDEVRPVEQAPRRRAVYLRYEDLVPVQRHITEVFGEILGVDVLDKRPSCVVDAALRDQYAREWSDRPRPWIALSRQVGRWTLNKSWPEAHWEALINLLGRWSTVIETGTTVPRSEARDPERYLDLRSQLSLGKLVAAIASADLHVGPESGPAHITAAVGTPAVIIYGGYIHPISTGYSGNINLYSPVPCAPCWLRELCPYGHPCLHQITPQQVDDALKELWNRKQGGARFAAAAKNEA